MHTAIRTFLTLVGMVFVAEITSGQVALQTSEQEVVNLVNQQRAAVGLPPLRVDPLLVQAARNHSINMARQNQGSHVLDGKGPGQRLNEVGYRGRFWGENIAWGARTPQQAMTLWMQSPPHRANILNQYYDEIGVGVAFSARGIPYWTQVFGRR